MNKLHLFCLLLPLLSLTGCATANRGPLTITLSALEDFVVSDDPDYVPAYRHAKEAALAIDAARYKDRFALAEATFTGPSGRYRLALTTLLETDGESTYRVLVDGEEVATVRNDSTTVDYTEQVHAIGPVRLRTGQVLGVAFCSASNGRIPEVEGFAFSRGRWRGVTFFGPL